MRRPSIDRGLQLIAASVLIALGTTTAVAQQPGSEQQPEAQPGAELPGIGQEEQRSETRSSELETAPSDEQASGGEGDLDQIAQEHEDISTFIEAVKAAGMTESLTGGTEYTAFAPTNEAFEQMSGLSTEELMQPENREQLISLLRAHLVADDLDEQLASTLEQAQTIDGGTVEIDASQEPMRVGDASVVQSDIQAGNLRIYAIDQVLSQGTELARADELGRESEEPSEAETEDPSRSDPLRDDALRDDEQTDEPLGGRSDDPLGGRSDDPFGGQSDRTEQEDELGGELGR